MTAKKDDLGQAEAQKLTDTAEDKGFLGVKVDPRPNSAYSLESGPESPAHVETINDRIAQAGPGEATNA